MLVVRKEGKAHDRYNSFRSAFELLEAVGHEPSDSFEELTEDLPTLQRLEQRVDKLMAVIQQKQAQIDELVAVVQQNQARTQQQIDKLTAGIDELKADNEMLRSKINHLGH